jgi:uncharacterized protein (DUF1778 family)
MMRVPVQTKALIEAAAQASNKTVSAFVVESARRQAVDVLLDQAVFQLSDQQAEAFAQFLEDPAPPTEKLKALMRGKAPWAV